MFDTLWNGLISYSSFCGAFFFFLLFQLFITNLDKVLWLIALIKYYEWIMVWGSGKSIRKFMKNYKIISFSWCRLTTLKHEKVRLCLLDSDDFFLFSPICYVKSFLNEDLYCWAWYLSIPQNMTLLTIFASTYLDLLNSLITSSSSFDFPMNSMTHLSLICLDPKCLRLNLLLMYLFSPDEFDRVIIVCCFLYVNGCFSCFLLRFLLFEAFGYCRLSY